LNHDQRCWKGGHFMKAAIVRAASQAPRYDNFPEPELQSGQNLIRVSASALSNLTRVRAAGRHYSSEGIFPFVPGADGVGRLEDGRRVYFLAPAAPYGAMAELAMVPSANNVQVPDELDDVSVAALVNPGVSSWAALRERADFRSGESVLINGATGTSGQLAVQIARHMGASKIVATGRNPRVLNMLSALGADRVVALTGEAADRRASLEEVFAGGIDVVLDYLWGEPARELFDASSRLPDPARPIRFVQIGAMAGSEISLPGAWLRSRATVLMGSGLGSLSQARIMRSIGDLLASAKEIKFRIATETAALSEVEEAWTRDTDDRRLVFVI
jgi:NADPH:quinone reductase-like Zn-dependent oxidoreductase